MENVDIQSNKTHSCQNYWRITRATSKKFTIVTKVDKRQKIDIRSKLTENYQNYSRLREKCQKSCRPSEMLTSDARNLKAVKIIDVYTINVKKIDIGNKTPQL